VTREIVDQPIRAPVDWPTTDLVAHRTAATPDRTALVDADRDTVLSYRELDERVGRRAAAMAAQGIGRSDRVGLLSPTSAAVVEVVHAAMRVGATLVLLNAELTPGELAPQVGRADVDAVLAASDLVGTASEAADCPVYAIPEPGDGGAARDDAVGHADHRLGESRSDARGAVHRDWTQLVLFTSGTTGEPKGVQLTAGNLVASATGSAFRLGVAPGDRWLVCLPTYHMGGLAPVVRSALYGTTLVLQRAFDAGETPQVLAERSVTGVSLVPTMLTRMLDAGWEPGDALGSVLLGGAPASDGLLERCADRDVPVYPTYGTTETASQIATATPEQAFTHEGTVGQPLVTSEVTVVDAEGDPLPRGETGELVVDGPSVTPGYLDDERTVEAFSSYGLHTGDVGYRDEDGRLWVVGRLDDVVVTGGENVHPAEVVDALRTHPAVEDAAVVGLSDPEWGERLAALVVGDVDHEELAAHCRDRLAAFKLPKTWASVEALPRTQSGTVDRGAVREQLRGQ
jgi:O-succinylbenzoic acid--CoA ligase